MKPPCGAFSSCVQRLLFLKNKNRFTISFCLIESDTAMKDEQTDCKVPLTPYEKLRLQNIARNNERLRRLGLLDFKMERRKKTTKPKTRGTKVKIPFGHSPRRSPRIAKLRSKTVKSGPSSQSPSLINGTTLWSEEDSVFTSGWSVLQGTDANTCKEKIPSTITIGEETIIGSNAE